jgi:hypothetical protein
VARFREAAAGWTRRPHLENNQERNQAPRKGVQQVKIRFMWKDKDSNVGNCPAMYEAPGGYVIQGKRLDAETRAQLRDLGSDEDGVFVPANVIDRIKASG